jgi:hypothetical protein
MGYVVGYQSGLEDNFILGEEVEDTLQRAHEA